MRPYKDIVLTPLQKEFVDEVKSNYSDLISEIGTDFGDIIVMLPSKLIDHKTYCRLLPLIDKYKLSFGISYYANDDRLMIRHFKTGPVKFSHKELWG